jgi:citrate lyase subunit alpha/citrate CoA-transferase
MIAQKITARFGSGGITGYFVDMLEEGLIETLFDVQSFDLAAVASIARNAEHHEMSASMYANIHNAGCLVNQLDVVILGATEVDLDFNVNVNTEADGELLHGIGGHQDTAAGAKLTIITAPLIRGRIPLISESVQTITSPGETIDAIVTDQGMAINPRRPELAAAAIKAGLPVKSIEELHQHCLNICGKPDAIEFEDEIVAVIEYRDGTILDTVRKVHHSS